MGTPSEDVPGFVPRSWSGFQHQAQSVEWGLSARVCVRLSGCLGAVFVDVGLVRKSLCGVSVLGLLLCSKL